MFYCSCPWLLCFTRARTDVEGSGVQYSTWWVVYLLVVVVVVVVNKYVQLVAVEDFAGLLVKANSPP